MNSYRIQFKSGRSFVFKMGDTSFDQMAAAVANNADGFLAVEDLQSMFNIREIESIQPVQSGQVADAAFTTVTDGDDDRWIKVGPDRYLMLSSGPIDAYSLKEIENRYGLHVDPSTSDG